MASSSISRRQVLQGAAATGILGLLTACAPGAAKAQDSLVPAADSSTTDLAANASTSASTTPSGLVHYANVSNAFYFYVVLQESIKRASEAADWGFDATNANFDTATELNQIQTALLKKPVALTMDTTDSDGLVAAVKAANAAKVPVGVVDVPVSGGDVAMTVTTDNLAAGVMAAETIVKLLEARYGSARGTVLNAYGAQSALGWRMRKQGWDSVMAKYPDINNVELPGEGDLTKTYDAAAKALAQYPDLDAAHAPSDYPAIGIVQALKANGKLLPVDDPKHVIIVTIDGDPVALDWIRSGEADAVVTQDPIAMGQIVIDYLSQYSVLGNPVPTTAYKSDRYYWDEAAFSKEVYGPHLSIPPYLITKDNVEDPRNYGNVAAKEWGIPYTMPSNG